MALQAIAIIDEFRAHNDNLPFTWYAYFCPESHGHNPAMPRQMPMAKIVLVSLPFPSRQNPGRGERPEGKRLHEHKRTSHKAFQNVAMRLDASDKPPPLFPPCRPDSAPRAVPSTCISAAAPSRHDGDALRPCRSIHKASDKRAEGKERGRGGGAKRRGQRPAATLRPAIRPACPDASRRTRRRRTSPAARQRNAAGEIPKSAILPMG